MQIYNIWFKKSKLKFNPLEKPFDKLLKFDTIKYNKC